MKYFITFSAIIAFALVSQHVTAQSGGLNVKDVNASEDVMVGSETGHHIKITDNYITLQPLTKVEIDALTPQPGMLVYDTDSDILKFYSGSEWKNFLSPEPVLPCNGTFYDDDGNPFQGIQIGEQCWMAENLKYLPSVVGPGTGSEAVPYYYVYGYNGTDVDEAKLTANYNTYGVLYNWSAALTACPDGWHLPSDAEWTELTNSLGGAQNGAGGKMKETGYTHWNNPNTGATNASGFTALPGGYLYYNLHMFFSVQEKGFWWSATESSNNASRKELWCFSANVDTFSMIKSNGYSVRCLRD